MGLALTLAALLGLTAASYWLHWAFVVDDAAISFSYARSFAQGYGLGALYPGAPRVEGYSNLLWVILLGLATRFGLDTLLASKLLGLAFSLGAVVVLFFSLRPFIRHPWLLSGLVLLPISLTFSFWSASGLENGLYGFMILLGVYFLIQEDRNPTRLPLGSAFSLILVAMTRPEGVIYGLTALLYKFIQLALAYWESRSKRTESLSENPPAVLLTGPVFLTGNVPLKQLWKNTLIYFAIFTLGYLAFKGWHLWYFAYLWPNPIYAKAGWYDTDLQKIWLNPNGWVYLRGYFRTFAGLGILPAVIFGGLVSLRGSQRVFLLFALAALVLPLYTPDWMVNYRFIYPFIPFEAVLIILGADQLWDWLAARGTRLIWLRLLALGLAIWFAYGLARFSWANIRLTQKQLACGYEKPWAEARCLDGKNYWSMAEVDARYAELDDYARQVGAEDPLYLIPDIGATSYLQNLRIIDLGGLADIHLARARDHQTRQQYLFQEQLPEFIQIHSIWTRRTDLTALKAFKDNYLPIEQKQDDNGRIHGTFIRRDLLLGDASQIPVLSSHIAGGNRLPKEIAPGLFLAGIQIQPATGLGCYGTCDQPLSMDLYWYTQSQQETDWQQSVRLVNGSGQMVHQDVQTLGYGWYPTSQWQPGEVLRQHVVLPPGLSERMGRMGTSATSELFRTEQDYSFDITALDEEGKAGSIASVAGAIVPEFGCALFRPECNSTCAQLPLLLLQARQTWQNGDLEGLVGVLQQANSMRKRLQVTQDWVEFGDELRSAARLAENSDFDETSFDAYLLYFAASLANPNDAWAQRGLEQARRRYLAVQVIAGKEHLSNSDAGGSLQ